MSLDPRYGPLKGALGEISADTKKTDNDKVTADNVVDKFVDKLNTKGIPKNQFKANLNKWPDQIQSYIKKQMFDYVNESNTFPEKDLPVIDKFFDTALQDADYSDANYTDERWAEAMKAVAQQLRCYYGVQDNDEELPCWRRG